VVRVGYRDDHIVRHLKAFRDGALQQAMRFGYGPTRISKRIDGQVCIRLFSSSVDHYRDPLPGE
jgi:hypothetical protein